MSGSAQGFGWSVFAHGLVDNGRREAVSEGLKAFVHLYYDEYSDAVALDSDTYRALEHLLLLGNTDLLDDHDLNSLLAEVQGEITAQTGRRFTPIETES